MWLPTAKVEVKLPMHHKLLVLGVKQNLLGNMVQCILLCVLFN